MPQDRSITELLNWRERPDVFDLDALWAVANEMESAIAGGLGAVPTAELRRELLRVDVHRTALLGAPLPPADAFALGEAAERRIALARVAEAPEKKS